MLQRLARAIAVLAGRPEAPTPQEIEIDRRLRAIEASLSRIESLLPTAENLLRAIAKSRREPTL